ncbi:type I-C CRISPR-associated protein Cas5c [Rhodopirellula europaea]|jgi:CRISPR-associated protein Cas5d|uniref:pre-crRNA processing endonuclease n=1 Tax=Rhodopirellula europaea SH398 TaxID=1263868 RepID=M5S9L0_9BACT|nr:type I-C CRISPR-associated protein Cas5c [Rhodopirellula europaea]EMI28181.1 CRISPR-associated protein Cas5, Dvulg subtype [Rhodopirellula europaea SH398]MCR9207982.1 type I-C CRISPR-associated protein Cas5c [bacterium]
MDLTKNRVALRVWGDLACFTRPEMKVERVSYDVITPSAARGVLEAIYWKPQIAWVIDRLHVLKPIRFTNIRRNELGGVGPSDRTLKPYLNGIKTEPLMQIIEDDRQQRAATLLQDVEYVIEAHYEVRSGNEPPQKHFEMFKRRASKGQCFQQPYLGCREFVADFSWQDEELPPTDESLKGKRDLGFMLHDIDFENAMTPRFFRATMTDGVIEVPRIQSEEVRS